jgi:uncharacterized protein
MTPSLRARLQADLLPALKAGDDARVGVLRTTLAALSNAEAVDDSRSLPAAGAFATDVARRRLSEPEVVEVVTGARDELRSLAAEMHAIGQADEGAGLDARAAILDGYLLPRDRRLGG